MSSLGGPTDLHARTASELGERNQERRSGLQTAFASRLIEPGSQSAGGAAIRGQVISRPSIMTWMRRSFAAAFVGLSVKLALTER